LAEGAAVMLLLDTQTFVWLASDLSELSGNARKVIAAERDSLFISGITGLEIGLAAKRKRLVLPVAPDAFVQKAMLQHGIRQIAVSAEIGCQAALLPDIHSDPFDRIIIATAVRHGMQLISKDRTIPQYPDVDVVW
jgi:PIN domain nuclease of toxin-antitoxin system